MSPPGPVGQTDAVQIEPDTKDWTWVITAACPECGFDPRVIDPTDVAAAVLENAAGWGPALAAPDAATRPSPTVWSALEYGCHVRDVHRLFAQRLTAMLTENDPLFANWDQDETAIAERYGEQDPAVVAAELRQAAAGVAAIYRGVRAEQWQCPGRRSNGSVFTVATLAVYHLHDVVHHLVDVAPQAAR